jgi:small subunit ribosomal protein S16
MVWPQASSDRFQPTGKRRGTIMAVRIRMKMMGRKHRQYFRIVAIDSRQPRDGRIIEELGSYDPEIKDTDERVKLKPDRIKYWLGVGAKPSERVEVFLKKYMAKFEHQAAVASALPPG